MPNIQKFEHLFSTDRVASARLKRAVIAAGTSGNNTIVAAVPGKIIRVYQLLLVSAGEVTTRWESAAGGTALTGFMPLVASSGYAPSFCPVGHFETVEGELLNLELSATITVGGWIVYGEI
jgi:hypothetical protein